MSDAPWLPGEAGGETDKRYAPATLRNRDAIVDVLRTVLPERGLVLEIASGSGEHVVHFARSFPALDWQPSDPDPAAIASIAAWSGEAGLGNLRPPVRIDAVAEGWLMTQADAVLCINMAHISPWAATVGLFREGAGVLEMGASLILYGPYVERSVETAPSNMAFDRSLKARNPEWGLRDLADMEAVAAEYRFSRTWRVEMQANNLMLIYSCGGWISITCCCVFLDANTCCLEILHPSEADPGIVVYSNLSSDASDRERFDLLSSVK